MKRFFTIEAHSERDMEAMLKLLREHGYAVTETPVHEEFETGRRFPRTESGGHDRPGTALRVIGASGQPDIHISADAMLISRAADGKIIDSNASFAELIGYAHAELLGQSILGPVFFLNPEFWTRVFRRLEAEGEVRDLETRILRKDGMVVFVTVSLRGVEWDGMPCHVITFRERDSDVLRGAPDRQMFFTDAALEPLLTEGVDIEREDVGRLIDFQALQDLMNSFYKITRIGIGINDINGNVQVATGWQDVCTRFHRIHPETLQNCLESDIRLSQLLGKGEALYKCKNGMWDLATPLIIGGRHIANIFLGQFFFEDEVPDYDFFRKQAEAYGFDADDYLAALDTVPRWSRELVSNVMEFYRKLAVMISRLSIGNIKLAQALAEQKRISEELQQANLIVENSPAVLFRWKTSAGWPVEFVSENVSQLGYAPEVFMSGKMTYSEMIHPEDLEKVVSDVDERFSRGIDRFRLEYRIITGDGAVRWVEERTKGERDEKGNLVCYQGIVIDITDRKQAEQELLLSKFCIDNAGIGIFHTYEQRIFNANEYACRSLGYSVEELRMMNISDIDPVITDEKMLEIKRSLEATGSATHQTVHRRRDGTIFPVEITTNQVEFQGRRYGVSFVKDITERKKAEEALRAKTEELDRYFTHALDLFCIADTDGYFRRLNKEWETALGYSLAELEGARFLDYVHPADLESTLAAIARLADQEEVLNFVNRYRAKDGSYRWIEWRSFPLGNLIYAAARDITDRKHAEDLLQASLTRLQAMVRNAPVVLYGFDRYGVFTLSEGKGLAGMGLQPGEVVGRSAFEIYRDHPESLENFRRALAGETFTAPVHTKDHVYDAYHEPVYGDHGEYAGTFGVLVDITERTRAEEALRQASKVVENSPVVLFRWRAEEGWPVEMVSNNVSRFGYPPQELLSGKVRFASMVYPEDLDRVAAEVAEYSIRGEERFQQEYRIVTREGDVRWIDDRTVVERDADGRITHYQGILMDITDRKRTENVISARMRLLQFAATHTLIELLQATLDEAEKLTGSSIGFYHYLEADQKTLSLQNWSTRTKQEFCKAEGEGRHYDVSQAGVWVDCIRQRRPVIHNDYASLPHRKGLPPGHAPVIRELVVPVFRGDSIVAIFGVGNKLLGYTPEDVETVSLLADLAWGIVEQKRAEEKVRSSLAEKEVLLKEVHHRVKNNLQIISSLLDLQADYLGDEQARSLFRDSQSRIRSMALIHQKLYQSESFTFIDLREYLADLAKYLFSTALQDPGMIELHVDVGDVSLGMDEAIPCGLIVNELISNSLKHAFPEGREGAISVKCRSEDDRITLTVSDNGVGLPSGLDFRQTDTLGLQLVTMLVRQLRGRIEMSGDHGTSWEINFSTNEPGRSVSD